ncbi:hypothetical protein BCR37DRAFT_232051 [Protomyces lactucae-debilis]|uniref:Uncharacterized protein n=1 Tax=Protomyces lactucae-debilis TaxID=2754530 RepID=A0A1Y2EPM1_PROLT|nr:uncharacterized protein BCR37DRAFT_232051 [Protomyces lactucae-debilis]ORY73468.1 hypothetical protein BCR37DRAFT_232051 [Protomyces lactucae-debilis]
MKLQYQPRIDRLHLLSDSLQGKDLWQGNILFTRSDFLASLQPPDVDINRKAQLYHVCGASLGALLEKRNCHGIDFVRAANILFAELDHYASREPAASAIHPSRLVRKEKGRKQVLSRLAADYTALHLSHVPFIPSYLDAAVMLLELLEEVHLRVMHEFERLRGFAVETGVNPAIYDDSPQVKEPLEKFDYKVRKLVISLQRDVEAFARAKVYRELDVIMDSLAVFD